MLVVCFWTMIELSLSTGYPRAVHARAVHALCTAHALSVCMYRSSVFLSLSDRCEPFWLKAISIPRMV